MLTVTHTIFCSARKQPSSFKLVLTKVREVIPLHCKCGHENRIRYTITNVEGVAVDRPDMSKNVQ